MMMTMTMTMMTTTMMMVVVMVSTTTTLMMTIFHCSTDTYHNLPTRPTAVCHRNLMSTSTTSDDASPSFERKKTPTLIPGRLI